MPSVRRAWRSATWTVPAAVLLTGCVSTQRIAARARLVDARILASQTLPVLARANPAIGIGHPVVVHGAGGSAIVVSLRNDSSSVLTDLPVSVGIRARNGRLEYLNRSANLDYFETHVAVIAPHAAVTWIYTTGRRVDSAVLVFATVGFPQFHPPLGSEMPPIAVSRTRQGVVTVINRSAIPQYDVPVYAVAVRGGRVVAAGRASVAHLGTHGRASATVTLLGNARGAPLQVIALPTIFS